MPIVQLTMSRAGNIAIYIVCTVLLLFVVIVMALLYIRAYDHLNIKPGFSRLPPIGSGNKQPPNRIRVRNLNTNLISKTMFNRKKIPPTVFHGVDVLILQEVFRTPSIIMQDNLKEMFKSYPGVQMAVAPNVPLTDGAYLDSGLAAISLHPSIHIACLAFKPFHLKNEKSIDSFSNKGVAIFRIGKYTIANVHMQSSYGKQLCSMQEGIRLNQFNEAVDFAKAHGACMIMGDINTSCLATLGKMDAIVGDNGHRVKGDNKSTSPRSGYSNRTWRQLPCKYGQMVDHVWVLDNAAVSTTNIVTNLKSSDNFSDHASLDFTIYG